MKKASAEIAAFLRKTLPFSELEDELLLQLATRCQVDFMPAGTRLMALGGPVPERLLLVQKGGVKLCLPAAGDDDAETLLDYRGEGGSVGELAIIQDAPPAMDAFTVEDAFFVAMEKGAFLDVVESRGCIAQYYLKTFSEKFTAKVFAEMRHRKPRVEAGGGLYLFSSRVREIMTPEPAMIDMTRTIQDAAREMVRLSAGSLLVREPSGEPCGIVTDKNLRAAVALGLDVTAEVRTIMSGPLVTVAAHDACFDALLRMMTRHIHHLAVVEQDRVVGVITSHDIMALQGRSPMAVFRQVMAANRLQELFPLKDATPQLARSLVEEGARASNIGRLIAALNDALLERALTLLQKELGPAPVPFCWLLMGSEGRREQALATDQDNAILFDDLGDDIIARAAEVYFDVFAKRAVDVLVQCGFPPCPGGVMASNPKWRMTVQGWREAFGRWMKQPEPQEVLHATIFFDFRGGFGERDLASDLRSWVQARAPRNEVFLRCMAQDCLESRPPLTFFRGFAVEKGGEHKNQLDLKKRALVPFVDFARAMALQHGVRETNTLGRLRALGEDGRVPRALGADASGAFEFLLQLRLVRQLDMIEQGLPPNNHVDPSRLSDLEQRTLKDAFDAARRLQAFLRESFKLRLG